MKPSHLLTILCFLLLFPLHAQQNTVQELGDELSAAFMARDSLKLYSLALPAEGMVEALEHYKKTLPEDIQKQATQENMDSLEVRYQKAIPFIFGLTYFNQINKLDIFDLELENLKFEKVSVPESKEVPNLVGVYASIPHHKFKHFTFYAYPFNEKWYLFNEKISISEENAFYKRKIIQAIQLSEDGEGNIVMQGSLPVKSKDASKSDILACVDTFPASVGIEEWIDESPNDGDVLAKGAWEYGYYTNNDEESAGIIEFQFTYTIHEGRIDYKCTDFIHRKEDSNYASLGQLTLNENDKILAVFSKKQYTKLLDDLLLNMRGRLRSFRLSVNRCLER